MSPGTANTVAAVTALTVLLCYLPKVREKQETESALLAKFFIDTSLPLVLPIETGVCPGQRPPLSQGVCMFWILASPERPTEATPSGWRRVVVGLINSHFCLVCRLQPLGKHK